MVYDRQTRSMLQTDQAKPDIGSQSGTVETIPAPAGRASLIPIGAQARCAAAAVRRAI